MDVTRSRSGQPSIEPTPTTSSLMVMPTGASALQSVSIRSHVTAAKQGCLPVTIGHVPIYLRKSPRIEQPRARHMWFG